MKLKNLLIKSEKLLFFLTILFLPTQLGKHFWPNFSSIYSLRIDYLSPTIYFWDLLVLALLVVWLLRKYFSYTSFNINKTALIIFSFFLLTQFASVIFALNQGAALVRFKEYLIGALFGLFLASLNRESYKKLLLIGLTLAVILSCFLGIAQFLTGNSVGLWILGERNFSVTTPLIAKFNFYDRVFLRPYATFSHPNMFAGFLLTVMPLLMSGFSNSLKGFKIMLALLISSTVFITFSRPALMLSSIFLITAFRKFWKILLLISVLIAPLIVVRFLSIFTYDSLALLRRQELTEFATRQFLTYPLLGVGLNNFINSLAASEVLVGTSRFLQPVHNIFLLSLSETGLLGFAGLLALLSLALYKNFKKRTPFNKALIGSLLTVIFLGLFDHYFLTLPQGQRLFFMLIGLSLSQYKKEA